MESVVGFKPTNNRFAVCLLRSLGYTDIVGTDEKTRTLTNSFGDYYATTVELHRMLHDVKPDLPVINPRRAGGKSVLASVLYKSG